jgi:hypothetical protein
MKDFNHQWGKIYDNKGEFREYLFKAWEQIWEKYANEPSVIGYDLLNEPYRENKQISYEDATQKSLIPLYIDLIEKMKSYSPEKWAIYQPLLVDNDEKAFQPNKIPMMEIYMPAVYDRLAFAPHPYYFQDNCEIGVNRHLKEAQSANAALLFGEWGHPVTVKADTLLTEQHRFTQWYADIVSVFDKEGVGLIKPWFTGTRKLLDQNRITWSMFSDTAATGRVERKYLVDVICRPYPHTMAGCKVDKYGFDLARRSFSMTFTKNDFPAGKSEIYVPEDRHYPDGFTIDYNGKVLLIRDINSPTGLKLIKTTVGFSKKSFRFDDRSQRLIISGWGLDDINNTIKINPGE